MNDCNPVATPMKLGVKLSKLEGEEGMDSNNYQNMIESLRYLTYIRPDITFILRVTNIFMEDMRYLHLKVVKKILRYVK
jgi:hypothetical protein